MQSSREGGEVSSAVFPSYWHDNADRLVVALRRSGDTHRAADILDILRSNDNAFWLATPESFLLSEVIDYPCKRVMNMSLAGGRLEDMLQFERTMVAFAMRAGCGEAQVQGREGWQKVLPGYHRNGVMLRKMLGS